MPSVEVQSCQHIFHLSHNEVVGQSFPWTSLVSQEDKPHAVPMGFMRYHADRCLYP